MRIKKSDEAPTGSVPNWNRVGKLSVQGKKKEKEERQRDESQFRPVLSVTMFRTCAGKIKKLQGGEQETGAPGQEKKKTGEALLKAELSQGNQCLTDGRPVAVGGWRPRKGSPVGADGAYAQPEAQGRDCECRSRLSRACRFVPTVVSRHTLTTSNTSHAISRDDEEKREEEKS